MSLRPSERAEVRRNKYKVAVDAEEGRRRREDNMVEIRKSRREESLQKKRREGMQAQTIAASAHAAAMEKKVVTLDHPIGDLLGSDCMVGFGFLFGFRLLDLMLGF